MVADLARPRRVGRGATASCSTCGSTTGSAYIGDRERYADSLRASGDEGACSP